MRDVLHTPGLAPGRVAARLRACAAGPALCLRLMILVAATLLSTTAHSAYQITQPPAQLSWSTSPTAATANVLVTRFESIQYYRYDPGSSTSETIWASHFATGDSATGATPATAGALPAPTDAAGNPIPLDQSIPLQPTNDFQAGETLFLVINQPQLPATAFANRSDGRRIMAITVAVDTGTGITNYTIALVETATGSNRFAGYLPEDATLLPLPAGSSVDVLYDNYADTADSTSSTAPYFVSGAAIDEQRITRLALIARAGVRGVSGLFLSKEALRSTVAQGELVPYRIRLGNRNNVAETDVVITDTLPAGFRLHADSVRIDGLPARAQLSATGRTLSITLAEVQPRAEHQIEYVLEATVLAAEGEAVNSAQAESAAGTRSNTARATVIVERAFLNDRAVLAGRVIIGECGDRAASGMAGVRLYLEDGSSVVTDNEGRWHLEGVKPGTHVLQLDEDTLGPRYQVRRCENNARKAGNALSRFVEPQGGSLWREDYYLSEKPLVSAHIQQRLMTEVTHNSAVIRVPIGNGETEFDTVDVEMFLPDSLSPVAGSALLDGKPLPDPVAGENSYTLSLAPKGRYWSHELTLTLALDPASRESVRQSIMVRSRGTTPTGQVHTVSSINEVDLIAAQVEQATLTLRPNFPTMSAELSAEDVITIEQAARFLDQFEELTLDIVGHTDAVPVRKRDGKLITNNQQLSLARAESVAKALERFMNVPAERISVRGEGARQPIASNNHEKGRALNRRVEISITTVDRVADASLALANGDSGLSRAGSSERRDEKDTGPGIRNLRDGMKVSLPVISINGTLDTRLTPKLMLDGEEIPASRLAMKIDDPKAGLSHYTWLGIELPESGDYEIELLGLGPFGNARFREKLSLTRTSDIKRIRLAGDTENVADGRTPIRVKLDLIDQSGRAIESRVDLRLLEGDLVPARTGQRADELNRVRGVVSVDADGYAWFDPVSRAGTYRVRLGNDKIESDTLEVHVSPYMRDWILVGYAKGSAGYSTLEDNIDAIPDAEKDIYTDGEAAFFARGRIRGDWLLTMAYDSRKEDGDTPLGGQFSPDEWYTLYGDNAQRGNDAASQEKLYLRLERENFYALFGDYETDLSITELSRYQRTLTGLKSEYRGALISANVFAAQTSQGYIRDDLRGDGTSGLYRISNNNIVPGSESIRIEVRDRFNNEIISSESRTRYADYSIDYDDGSMYFREPVPAQDATFNPVYIVVEYEIDGGVENVTGGGRVAVHTMDRQLEVGVTGIHDGTEGNQGNLSGADLKWLPNEKHTIKAEFAQTRQEQVTADDLQDNAWILEHRYESGKLDTRVRAEEQGTEFGLGQQSPSESGIRQTSGEARYRINESYTVSSEVRRQEMLDADQTRDSVDGRLEYDRNDWRIYAGARHATDSIDDEEYRSDLAVGGVQKRLFDKRLTLSADGETSLNGSDDNNDYPNKLSLGADWRVTRIASVFANQEFAWGNEYNAQETRAGVRATPWQGGTLTTDVGQQSDEFAERIFSHAGLYQNLQLTNHWSADLGADRAQTLKHKQRNPSFDEQNRDPASGTNNDDYTAFSAGLGYRDSAWQWTSRLEHRISDSSDKWNLFSGAQHRLDGANTLIARIRHRQENFHQGNGQNEWDSQLDVGFSHRPNSASWWALNRTSLIFDGLEDSYGKRNGRRLVNNLTTNFSPDDRHQLALMYGARYVLESINGDHYNGYSDLISGEYRFNLTQIWDIGARGSLLQSHQSNVSDRSYGVMVGVSPVDDVWVSLGYNFRGFYDSDFDNANSRVAGIVLDFRIKFDQNSARRWRGERD